MTDARILRPTDPEWPSRLNELAGDHPPEKLHVRGRLLEPGRTAIAIVGTRRPTVSGIEIATTMARAFAEAGFVVVSGLAMGIDAAAHKACVEAGGHTVAVLGCGLDIDYPRANAKLRGVIANHGTFVTEYECGTEPHAFNFPKRNRIVAGLSHAVVVVEGGTKSGSLITARLGIEYGREVFAVPGNPRNLMSIAPNELIRTGQAALAACPEHVFEVLAPQQAWLEPCDTQAYEGRLPRSMKRNWRPFSPSTRSRLSRRGSLRRPRSWPQAGSRWSWPSWRLGASSVSAGWDTRSRLRELRRGPQHSKSLPSMLRSKRGYMAKRTNQGAA